MKVFQNDDCSYAATIGHAMHYQDASGQWNDVDLRFHGDGNGGYIEDQSDVIVRVKGATVEAADRSSGEGIRWVTPGSPAVSGREASFKGQGLSWTYTTRTGGIKLSAPVEAALGQKTYQFPYKLMGGAKDFTVDSRGNLVSGSFIVPRSVAIGADLTRYDTSPWVLLPGSRVGFSFNDSVLPASAFPYMLDPTTLFVLSPSRGAATSSADDPGDDGAVSATSPTYPVSTPATADDASPVVLLQRSRIGNSYTTSNGLFRWDTSPLPDEARIEAAHLLFSTSAGEFALGGRTPSSCIVQTADGRQLVGEWYDFGNEIDATDYSATTSSNAAIFGVYLSDFNNQLASTYDIKIDNPAGISVIGSTGLRMSINGTDQEPPTGTNSLCLASEESLLYPDPQLVLNYVIPPVIEPPIDEWWDPPYAGDGFTWGIHWKDLANTQVKALICKVPATVSGRCPLGQEWSDGAATDSYHSPDPDNSDGWWHGESRAWAPTTQKDIGGPYTYYAFACDASGVCSAPQQASFRVVNRPPAITGIEFSKDPAPIGNPVTITVHWADTADDTVGVGLCRTQGFQTDSYECVGEPLGSGLDGNPHAPNTVSTGGDDSSQIVYTPSADDGSTLNFYAYAWDTSKDLAELQGSLQIENGSNGGPPPAPGSAQGSATNPPYTCWQHYDANQNTDAPIYNSEGTDLGAYARNVGIKANVLFGRWNSNNNHSGGDCIRVSSINVFDAAHDGSRAGGYVELGWFLGWDTGCSEGTVAGICSVAPPKIPCEPQQYRSTPTMFVVWSPIGGQYHCAILQQPAISDAIGSGGDYHGMRIDDVDEDATFDLWFAGVKYESVSVNYSLGFLATNGERHNLTLDTASARFQGLQQYESGGNRWKDFCCSQMLRCCDDDPGYRWQKSAGLDTATEVDKG
ncbi:MAG: hypothetical protein ABR600_11920 [Actinomycetota bacterium]|nr:hypothetical protein [Actinomycetota bacterium]